MAKEGDRSQKESGCCGPKCCGIGSLITAVVFGILAIITPFIVSPILDKQMKLVPGTINYDFWQESPVPMYLTCYMFNVTNSEDVVKNNSKPIVQQLGPYTFSEVHRRVYLEPHPENFTLTFMNNKTWHFVEEMSVGPLDTNITNLNVPLLSAMYAIRFKGKFVKEIFNTVVTHLDPPSELFITKTVGELLFDGYSDKLLNLSQYVSEWLNISIPDDDKFGWFYERNNSVSYDGVFSVFTGEDDISKLYEMDMWNFTRQTTYYESYCGMINGSFGEGWPPRRERTNISMYSTDLCRSITLDYTKDVRSDNGLTFYRYAGTERMFASKEENPDNWCFCSGGVCNPSGVVNSSLCRFGSPAFVSFPHYYLADPFFQGQVDGLSPKEELHGFHVDLEPRTAVPLSVAARFQINIQMMPIQDLPMVENINEVYVPVMWFEVTAEASPAILKALKFTLQGPILGSILFSVAFCSFLVATAISAVIYVRRKNSRAKNMMNSNDQLVDDDVEPSNSSSNHHIN